MRLVNWLCLTQLYDSCSATSFVPYNVSIIKSNKNIRLTIVIAMVRRNAAWTNKAGGTINGKRAKSNMFMTVWQLRAFVWWTLLLLAAVVQGWSIRGSRASCDSLPGFTRLLRQYRFYPCISHIILYQLFALRSWGAPYTRDATYTRTAWKCAWWLLQSYTHACSVTQHTC